MKRRYINESHRKYCEACAKANEEMSKHPLSREAMKAQCDMIEKQSRLASKQK